MKVTKPNPPKPLRTFAELKVGVLFQFTKGGGLWMKISHIYPYNCVLLEGSLEGSVGTGNLEEKVIEYEGTLEVNLK